MTIFNSTYGLKKGWTWAGHKLRGYTGGTDYRTVPDTQIQAPVKGVVYDIAGSIKGQGILHASGWAVEALEIKSGRKPGTVVYPSDGWVRTGDKWLHLHSVSPAGKRYPYATGIAKIRSYEAKK